MRSGTELDHDVLDQDDAVSICAGALFHRHTDDGLLPALRPLACALRYRGQIADHCEIDRVAVFAVRIEDRCARHVGIALMKAAASEGGHDKGSSLLPGAWIFYWMIAHRDSCCAG